MRRRCLISGDLPPQPHLKDGKRWLPVQGYEGYLVSEAGDILSKRTGLLLKGGTNSSGYLTVNLRGPEKVETVLVHHVVACHWHSRSYKRGLTVTHRNGVRKDNAGKVGEVSTITAIAAMILKYFAITAAAAHAIATAIIYTIYTAAKNAFCNMGAADAKVLGFG